MTQGPSQCGICLEDRPGASFIVLQSCLHRFCKPCLRQYVKAQTDPASPADAGQIRQADLVSPPWPTF